MTTRRLAEKRKSLINPAVTALLRHLRRVKDVRGETVLKLPEDAHRPLARVRDVRHGAGVQVGRRSKRSVSCLGFADEKVDGRVHLAVLDVALSGRGPLGRRVLRLPLEKRW